MKKRKNNFVFLFGRRKKKVEKIFWIFAVSVRMIAQLMYVLTMILSHC